MIYAQGIFRGLGACLMGAAIGLDTTHTVILGFGMALILVTVKES